ncbi:MAG TPA: hypothetical protein DCX45_03785 [Acinetobacter junii]|uniref:Uncharacterized protein n=1 Tax=Candidatus Woesebacteria bacterium GW2011_GWB1_38_8 TaxID=1618570 RepID=A0A0G0P6G8_9BACT|nr:MAG: hypothetical protein US60_C0025G0006 [Microgenomates group bacterium GW2011_GWC1_37_8]KKQ84916.1 MAG: hypothetical protein UT08_C0012G0012 [Candidatus Woesebacteria bacterium GW2011_GWB1_38_8]HAV56644.1 hypothetical protein [Acinetobacter junii]
MFSEIALIYMDELQKEIEKDYPKMSLSDKLFFVNETDKKTTEILVFSSLIYLFNNNLLKLSFDNDKIKIIPVINSWEKETILGSLERKILRESYVENNLNKVIQNLLAEKPGIGTYVKLINLVWESLYTKMYAEKKEQKAFNLIKLGYIYNLRSGTKEKYYNEYKELLSCLANFKKDSRYKILITSISKTLNKYYHSRDVSAPT